MSGRRGRPLTPDSSSDCAGAESRRHQSSGNRVGRALGEEELLKVAQQEFLGAWLVGNQSVVIDELLLGLEPVAPADFANGVIDTLAEFRSERLERLLVALLAAPDAMNGRHAGEANRDLLTPLQRLDPARRAQPAGRPEDQR